ncbi:MAG: SpoIIE family protein phosphatase [bacterium]
MNNQNLECFRKALINHRDSLQDWLCSNSNQKQIRLASTEQNEVLQLIAEIKNALVKIEKGDFGKCLECGEDVEFEQLEYDFTSCLCLSHYSEAQLRTLERELELASRVQKDLLPCCLPALPETQIAAHTESARIVGGDYYDFFEFQNTTQGLAIADVMDKGLPASMLMSNLQASLRILGPEHSSLDALAKRLNKFFLHNLNLIRFISVFLAAIDVKTKTLQYCNAGHHPPLWWQGCSQTIHWLQPTGPALGLTAHAKYNSKSVNYANGDLFVFYTDGLIEAGNNKGQEFGEESMAAFVKEHQYWSPDEILNGLLAAAKNCTDRFHDDVTLIVLKVE